MRDDERVLWEEGNPPEKEKERKERKKNEGEDVDMRVQNRFRWSRFGLHPRYQARKLN